MKIYVLGDVAVAREEETKIVKELLLNPAFDKNSLIISNLEGLIIKENQKENNALYNNINILEAFLSFKTVVFSLANNHTKDIEKNFEYTISTMKNKKTYFTGAGLKKEEANLPAELEIDGNKYAIFSHCWEVMSKMSKNKNIKISDEKYAKFINRILDYKKKNPKTYIITYFHWNFDFEKLPFPQHRKIARKLIDNGVDAVLGGHSHVINGGEIYKGKPIVYGFGNFFISENIFFNGKIRYPEECKKTFILEIDTNTNKINCIWINLKKDSFDIICKEEFEKSKELNKYSEYANMTEKEYTTFFRKNRIKKKLVPIYKTEKDNIQNKIKDYYIISRIKFIRFLRGVK